MLKKFGAILVALFAAVLFGLTLAPVSANSAAAPASISFGIKSSCTTNASGYCTINHGLGVAPDTVQAQAINFTAITTTRNWTATSVEVRFAKRVNTSNGVDPWANTTFNVSLLGTYIPSTTPTTSPTTSPPTTTPTTSPPTTTPPTTVDFPNADNTGVPAGTVLTPQACSGTLTITTPNTVIDSKTLNCDIAVHAAGVVISKSRVTGSVYTENNDLASSFRLEDSEITFPTIDANGRTMVGEANFVLLRSEVTGGNRGVYCRKACTVQDSWIHGTKVTASVHASGVRVSQGSNIIHNTLHCDAADQGDAGCSADLTGYPDFEPVKNNTIRNNLFKATPGGFCAYGGATATKPYSNDPTNATNIVFQDNTFERGSGGKCGFWGAITDFEPSRTGNVWSGNKWNDGTVVNP